MRADSDFFALGGTSLAAASLVSLLRERYPEVSVADLYHHPGLQSLADRLDGMGGRAESRRVVRPTPRRAGFVQLIVLAVLFTVTGARWLLGLAAVDNLMGPLPWTPHTSWWLIGGAWLVLSSALGRMLIGAAGARLLTAGMRPGSYPRGGATHLRLWTAERLVAVFNVAAVTGTPLARRYARLLGCKVGADVELHTMPPVTGMATFGDGCSVEAEVDVAGWWLDGDVLQLGTVRIGAGARVGTRSMMMPGAEIGAGAEIAPGSCVTGHVPAWQYWHGSPARREPGDEVTGQGWPAPEYRRSRFWNLAYAVALPGLQLVPLLASLPALAVLYSLVGTDRSYANAFRAVLLAAGPLAVVTMLCYATLLAMLVRLFGRALTPGVHPAHGRTAWCAWAVHRLMDTSRSLLFPFYASLFTPVWLRLLGADIGRRVEASTVIGLPSLMTVDDGAFLADDTMVAPFEVRGGWLWLGRSYVGRRSFVGNSGIVGPERNLPDNTLVGVLSDAPAEAREGSSWLGRPGFSIARAADQGDSARTYDPPARLVWARAAVEVCRIVPVLIAVVLADLTVAALQELLDLEGLWVTAAGAGLVLFTVGVLACLITTAAKWLLVGRFRESEHPLWSSFVWRNELYDVFVEELAMPALGTAATGTPLLNLWLRSLGAKIGRGVWCESHWLPETDLVTLEAGVSINRGVVVQTHLFHDRLMRLGSIQLDEGATVGPHSIVLLDSTLGEGAVAGPSSLVMRGESVPGGTRWLGNPVAAWPADPTPGNRPPGRHRVGRQLRRDQVGQAV